MKQLTEQQIQDNYLKLRSIINDTFTGERLEKLNTMYDHFENRMVLGLFVSAVAVLFYVSN